MAQSPENQTDQQRQAQAPKAQASAVDKTVGAARDTSRAAADATDQTVEGERRSFADGAEAARRTADGIADATRQNAATGAQATRDIAATAADTSRRLTETGRQTTHEVADLWRSSLEPLPGLQLEMTRMFDDFWRGAFGLGGFPTMRASRPFAGLGAASLFGQPPVDVKETEAAYLLAIEAPGLDADDLDVALDGDSLTVRGHKAEEREDATAAYRISERRFGRFERRFPITGDVDRQNIEAQYRDGVLKITLPKHGQSERPRTRIEVQRDGGGQSAPTR
jgi:HSP20 family protein